MGGLTSKPTHIDHRGAPQSRTSLGKGHDVISIEISSLTKDAAGIRIDPAVRGSGCATDLILTAAELIGGNPARNDKGLGFLMAGCAAHAAAYRKAVALAIEQGLVVAPKDTSPI